MIRKIKGRIQDMLAERCHREYKSEVWKQSNPYWGWIEEIEKTRAKEGLQDTAPSVCVINLEDCCKEDPFKNLESDIVIVISKNGKLHKDALLIIPEYFSQNEKIDIAYADEDIWYEGEATSNQEIEKRMLPWVKPIWSRETFLSFFYFGNIFAMRRDVIRDYQWLADQDYQKNIYDFMLQITHNTNKIGHLESILFHKYVQADSKEVLYEKVMNSTDMLGIGTDFDHIKRKALSQKGIDVTFAVSEDHKVSYPIYGFSEKEYLVSIIIPSKDNVEVLLNCIHSIKKYTERIQYEIIVVDNGSNERNKSIIEQQSQVIDFIYHYEIMDFNFSRMCNLGVSLSKGNMILLLNDDMEIITSDWLYRMAGQLLQEGVGSVGAKLYYPNSTLIQHVGITNTVDGPGHKLKQFDDTKYYYYGHNKLIYDVIGVTAACMLVKKSTYNELNGLYEGLKVAFNDVDFCFRIEEAGLHNVIRNDVVLYHHESLSRGDDMQDTKKMQRLMMEKETLYKRHENLYMLDPYCGRSMNLGTSEYECRVVYEYEYADETGYEDYLRVGKSLPDYDKTNHAIMVVVEEHKKETLRKAGKEQREYYICKGWAYIPGTDNSRYELFLTFVNKKNNKVWEIPVKKRYRKDVANILPNETNVELSGFVCWIYQGNIPKGSYEIWMVAKDRCSRQVLYRNTEKELIISE